jgi:hypothetical protein
MKISREHNLSGSRVYIKYQTSIKVWPLRLELSVFTRSFEPLTRSPTECYNACFFSFCWTRDLWPKYPRVQIALRKHSTLNNLYCACQCYSKRLTLMQKWSAALLVSNPFCILTWHTHSMHLQDFPLDLWCSLRPQLTAHMQGTATQVPHPWYSLSSTCTPLLRLESLKSSSYLGTNLSWVLYKATWQCCWRSGKITTTSQVLLKKTILHNSL